MDFIQYSLGGNVFFAVAFGLLLPPQIYFGIRYKTWGFLFGMFSGLLLEVIGYIARVQMHFGKRKFLIYIVTITIGPAFFSAAIYLCLARIIAVYGDQLSRFRPRTITITFMLADFSALVLQAAGGAIAGGEDTSRIDLGLSILQAGLSVHLVAITVYVGLSAEFAYSAYRRRDAWNIQFNDLQASSGFMRSLIGLAVATICILIRTSFRVAELSQGFTSALARNETAFFVLESSMVLVATLALTIFHPGLGFEGRWPEADFNIRTKRGGHKDNGSGMPRGDVLMESL